MSRAALEALREAWRRSDWNGVVGPGELVLLLDALLAEDAPPVDYAKDKQPQAEPR